MIGSHSELVWQANAEMAINEAGVMPRNPLAIALTMIHQGLGLYFLSAPAGLNVRLFCWLRANFDTKAHNPFFISDVLGLQ